MSLLQSECLIFEIPPQFAIGLRNPFGVPFSRWEPLFSRRPIVQIKRAQRPVQRMGIIFSVRLNDTKDGEQLLGLGRGLILFFGFGALPGREAIRQAYNVMLTLGRTVVLAGPVPNLLAP